MKLKHLTGYWRYCLEDDPGFSAVDYDPAGWLEMFIPRENRYQFVV